MRKYLLKSLGLHLKMYNPLLFPHLWSRLVANSILQNHNKKHSNLTCKSARNVALPARKTCSFWQQFCDMEVIYNFYYIQKFSTWQICREEWGVWIMYKDEQNLLLSSYPSLFMHPADPSEKQAWLMVSQFLKVMKHLNDESRNLYRYTL